MTADASATEPFPTTTPKTITDFVGSAFVRFRPRSSAASLRERPGGDELSGLFFLHSASIRLVPRSSAASLREWPGAKALRLFPFPRYSAFFRVHQRPYWEGKKEKESAPPPHKGAVQRRIVAIAETCCDMSHLTVGLAR